MATVQSGNVSTHDRCGTHISHKHYTQAGLYSTTNEIDFNGFQALWGFVQQWANIFRQIDRDNSGALDQNEVKTALTNFGTQ
jgi:hypothetical protein